MSHFQAIPEPWRTRYQRFAQCPRPMVGGSEGQRFVTNGHWMARVDEATFQACVAAGWFNVGASWSKFIKLLDGRRSKTIKLAEVTTIDADSGRFTKFADAYINAEYAELLTELGAVEVLVFDGAEDSPFVYAPGLAIVSAIPGDRFEARRRICARGVGR